MHANKCDGSRPWLLLSQHNDVNEMAVGRGCGLANTVITS